MKIERIISWGEAARHLRSGVGGGGALAELKRDWRIAPEGKLLVWYEDFGFLCGDAGVGIAALAPNGELVLHNRYVVVVS